MQKHVLVPLAQGCEEMEAVTIIDLLRRAEVEVTVAGLVEGVVTGSRGVRLLPDTTLDEALQNAPAGGFDMVALPGGLPGADHLASDPRIAAVLTSVHQAGGVIAAVCAAPKVLARHGLLQGRQATAYPGVLEAEKHTAVSGEAVTCDGKVITSRSAGTALDFALELIQALCGAGKRELVERSLAR